MAAVDADGTGVGLIEVPVAGSRLLGSEVGRWVGGLGAPRLHDETAAVAAGADRTRDDG